MTATCIDLFAGAGGFTTGARAAGARVLWAANHWAEAVEIHRANHPETAHACQDLHQADWSIVPQHDVLLASPACQGHSRARGRDRPGSDVSRTTAWAVVSAVEFHRPQVFIVENVREFREWSLFPVWRDAMRALGYSISENVIDAADVGVPQRRVRLFLVGTKSKTTLQLGRPDGEPRRTARSVVDFSAGTWSPILKPGRSARTLARVRKGRERFGDRFLTAYYGSERGGRSLDEPVGTITTRNRHAIIDGDRMRMMTVAEIRAAMAFPADYILPPNNRMAVHMMGNAVCPPVAEWVIRRVMERL